MWVGPCAFFLSQHTICPFFWGEREGAIWGKRSWREGGVHIVLFYSLEYLSNMLTGTQEGAQRNIFTTEQSARLS